MKSLIQICTLTYKVELALQNCERSVTNFGIAWETLPVCMACRSFEVSDHHFTTTRAQLLVAIVCVKGTGALSHPQSINKTFKLILSSVFMRLNVLNLMMEVHGQYWFSWVVDPCDFSQFYVFIVRHKWNWAIREACRKSR